MAILLKKSVEFRIELWAEGLDSTFFGCYFTLSASDSFKASSVLEKVILIAVGVTLKVPSPLPRGTTSV